MRILITGSGGREHAIAWRLARDIGSENIFVAPGNAGTKQCATNIDCSYNNFEMLANHIDELHIDLLMIGPEEPLVNGFTDYLKQDPRFAKLMIVGPGSNGAILEGSKDFAKQFMNKYSIPTAAYQTFESKDKAAEYIRSLKSPYVLKADGLAAGKGVVIAQTEEEALKHIDLVFQNRVFGDAGNKLVIEEFLDGIEMSVFALTDGRNYVLLPEAKDYKRIGDGDTGPNTGGMGTVSPVPFANKEFMQKVVSRIVEPTISGIAAENMDYCGFIFIGLMNVGGDPFVIEYNVRLGDPETQVILPRIGGSFIDLLTAAATQQLEGKSIEHEAFTTLSIVLASEGYPGAYKKGNEIEFEPDPNDLVFHAGTAVVGDKTVTAGGRVLAVVGKGNNVTEAMIWAYENAERIKFEGVYYRNDIGFDLMKYENI
ncbi:MAG: phosphoribosylamine--glycine ligase [Bacteroidetes bacterium HGW-Bacteroidetes-6]|jgi:phosphoribosylamine--glycine ligase|nr:MAG: phosphoribosylamine--glycine ligase [Bacteroidetes bacterium HGW-Bacteroidetes-6]